MKDIFNSKQISNETKLRIFNALIESIFLYNCEVWTVTKAIEKDIDIFQRNLLRRILNIKWSDKVSNEKLYEKTKTKRWSEKIKKRRLSWFGHLCRLPENCPAKQALYEALKPAKKPRGRPLFTWLELITNQVKELDFDNIYDAIEFARDRQLWKSKTNT